MSLVLKCKYHHLVPSILRMDLINRGHERFVNEIHRHISDIANCSSSLRTKEENLNNACFENSKPVVVNLGQGSQDSNKVEAKVEPFKHASGNRCLHDTGSPGLLEKQQRRQSFVNTSKGKVHLLKRNRSPKRTEFGL